MPAKTLRVFVRAQVGAARARWRFWETRMWMGQGRKPGAGDFVRAPRWEHKPPTPCTVQAQTEFDNMGAGASMPS